jgi:hypothetical protein
VKNAEADQLRADIRVLQVMLDSALERGADDRVLAACSEIIRERRERLEELEAPPFRDMTPPPV